MESQESLIDRILDPDNLNKAFKRVKKNKGAAGVDGKDIEATHLYLKEEGYKLVQLIREGKYKPKPVRRVEIPKPNGGKRKLGIPTVTDRIFQQAVVQKLTPIFEKQFSPYSYGFRPNRSAHQAIEQARQYIEDGYNIVVDIDLEKFFDRVQHDKLMSLVAKTITDKPTLKLIRRYLQAGIMENGLVKPNIEGTPQGGPLSPLLSNIMLNELDKELERRGLRFVRYADDCNIFVKSMKAGERVKTGISKFIEKKLKLKVNQEKSAVGKPSARIFLGVSFYRKQNEIRVFVPQQRKERFETKLKKLTNRNWGVSMEERIQKINQLVQGWGNYFKIADIKTYAIKTDSHIRRRLRACRWKEWKKVKTKYRNLLKLGISEEEAWKNANTRKGYWRISNNPIINLALNNRYWQEQGLKSLATVIS
ncbi:group II intron reverse transcriptase/maturase [Bacillus methanolicus]|uniref:group II intron reverse transcriptase/maturase n=1 Tax=Bacillus methanolicus TaxID=1471 RepID=UPI0023806752|nr:group II intron reverse transcriptase/maturase [Bacillus methanolicus]MDE3838620.1 group II intron reverse transcriptase/maturase [Bacillus methanolicus]MDE3839234.1 group II intron reverse transcriptase/maturase [Bacillus methanolicus]MDE3839354.1 group II intron reverse transcriptase/maturase [Bacillus methanolicus]